jgi:exodeoxyribonuclease VII small subunit
MNDKKIVLADLLKAEDSGALISSIEFEDGVKLLDELCGQIESGELPLSMAVTSYERGMQLIEALSGQLNQAEAKIKVLQG